MAEKKDERPEPGQGSRATANSEADAMPISGDVDEYRKRYGKVEGERRFFADHGGEAPPTRKP